MKNILLFLFVLIQFSACSQSETSNFQKVTHKEKKQGWDPDAGVIPSLTIGSKVTSSTNLKMANKVLDEKKESHWQSEAPFPTNFINRKDQNILLNYFSKKENYNASKISSPKNATDGNSNSTTSNIGIVNGEAFLEIIFKKPQAIKSISLKAGGVVQPIEIFSKKNNQLQSLGKYEKANDYQVLRFSTNIKKCNSIVIKSKTAFQLFEIAALESAPKEWVMVDLGKIQNIGWVDTRHWAGDKTAVSTALLISEDGKNWKKVKDLDPNALQTVTTIIEPAQPARFVKVEHGLIDKDWSTVFIWEIDIYDQFGPFGKMPETEINPNTFSEILGVNGIWGWGFEKYADLVPEGRGADLFEKVSSHARNYHFLNWDVLDPDTAPDYAKMAEGKGTEVNWWLDWDREYKTWTEGGMKLQTSIQFRDIPKDQWNTPYESAYKFGYNFAQHFGPTSGNGLVDAIEAGNEPWYYEANFYKKILHGMTKGIKDADPKITVLPCALQAVFPANEYEGQFKNYIGARVTPEVKNNIDAINTHLTPWSYNEKGEQIATHPEHPYNGTRAILNMIRFRDHNLPKLPIYVTEWGWDSDGGTEECVHGECVSERAQALYAVRGALMLARTGVDRATWYFFANENKESSLFTRSGLVSSLTTDFQIKQAFVAWQAFLHHLGDKHFLRVIQEDEEAWVYELGKADGTVTHIAAWRPIEGDNNTITNIEFTSKYRPVSAWKLEGKNEKGQLVDLPKYKNGKIKIEVSAVPVVIKVQ